MGSILEYKILEKIGEGSFGVVYRVTDSNNQHFVLKQINTEEMSSIEVQMVEDEISALTSFSSPYIVHYHDSFNDGDRKIIIMEYINGTTMLDLIVSRVKFTDDQILRWMRCIIYGLLEIHQKGYAHRDIKPENIMIQGETAKIIDLGFSCSDNCRNIAGSLNYSPPEMFNSKLRGINASQAHDIWSLGVTLFVLANLDFPYELRKVVNGKYVEISKKEFTDILNRGEIHKSHYTSKNKRKAQLINEIIDHMLTVNWKDRPDINDIIEMLEVKGSKKCIIS